MVGVLALDMADVGRGWILRATDVPRMPLRGFGLIVSGPG